MVVVILGCILVAIITMIINNRNQKVKEEWTREELENIASEYWMFLGDLEKKYPEFFKKIFYCLIKEEEELKKDYPDEKFYCNEWYRHREKECPVYFCHKCLMNHKHDSVVGREHFIYGV